MIKRVILYSTLLAIFCCDPYTKKTDKAKDNKRLTPVRIVLKKTAVLLIINDPERHHIFYASAKGQPKFVEYKEKTTGQYTVEIEKPKNRQVDFMPVVHYLKKNPSNIFVEWVVISPHL